MMSCPLACSETVFNCAGLLKIQTLKQHMASQSRRAVPQRGDLAWHVNIKCCISKGCGISLLYSYFLERLDYWSTACSVENFKVSVHNKKCRVLAVYKDRLTLEKAHWDRSKTQGIYTLSSFILFDGLLWVCAYGCVGEAVASFNNWIGCCQNTTRGEKAAERNKSWEGVGAGERQRNARRWAKNEEDERAREDTKNC